jgi:hypothetical protein
MVFNIYFIITACGRNSILKLSVQCYKYGKVKEMEAEALFCSHQMPKCVIIRTFRLRRPGE